MVTLSNSRPVSGGNYDGLVFGVASGLATVTGIDPAIIRAVFVVAAMIGGLGLIVYLALAATSTVRDDQLALVEGDDRRDEYRTQLWIGGLAATALVGGALALLTVLFDWPMWIAPGAIAAAVLLTLAGGMALRRRR